MTADDRAPGYPLTLDVAGRRVVVVGGGPVAARRVRGLVDAGAAVEVIAPGMCEELHDLALARVVAWTERDYQLGDLVSPRSAWLVHTATGDRDTDDAVSAHADAARIWCVRADDAGGSSAWTPAVARGRTGTGAEGLTVAVGGGGDPRRAVAVRDAVRAALESGVLPVRRVRRGGGPVGTGRVALVGGGPGAEDLLTVRGRTLLATADVVVTDRLAPRDVVDGLGEDVEVIDVGKAPGRHPVPQHRINEILVDHARRGAHVVRLKGGDPFVLGRGGEEALHCAEHGIPVEVVPGVTSAVSVPAAAGIPMTHRGVTTSFVVVSGHDGPGSVVAAASAAPAHATLVLLMAVTRLGDTAAGLVAAGRPADTPVAVVESGWTPEQRVTWTTLATARADAEAAGVRPPAVVVIGDVVSVGRDLAGAASRLRPASA